MPTSISADANELGGQVENFLAFLKRLLLALGVLSRLALETSRSLKLKRETLLSQKRERIRPNCGKL